MCRKSSDLNQPKDASGCDSVEKTNSTSDLGRQRIIPCLSATATASVRSDTLNLSVILATWHLTVCLLKLSAPAISLFVRPLDNISSTSTSRDESDARWSRSASRDATSGA